MRSKTSDFKKAPDGLLDISECWANDLTRITKGDLNHGFPPFSRGIHSSGVLQLPPMPQSVKERGKVLSPIMFGVLILVLVFLVAGIWLFWVGETD